MTKLTLFSLLSTLVVLAQLASASSSHLPGAVGHRMIKRQRGGRGSGSGHGHSSGGSGSSGSSSKSKGKSSTTKGSTTKPSTKTSSKSSSKASAKGSTKGSIKGSTKGSIKGSTKGSTGSSSGKIAGQAIPAGVQSFANSVMKQKKCEHQLDTMSGGFKNAGDTPNAHYCGDQPKDPKIIFWVSNMDVDCDGTFSGQGACGNDPSGQGETAFDFDGGSLNAMTQGYVVINQQPQFNPTKFGMDPLGVVTCICNGKMVHGVWGDTNEIDSMGEASIGVAQACFGSGETGDSTTSKLVLYIAHTGKSSVPSSPSPAAVATLGNSLIDAIDFKVDLTL